MQVKLLPQNPFLCTLRYKDVRFCVVKNFPFMIRYTVDELNKLIEIFAIIHTSRDQKFGKRRVTNLEIPKPSPPHFLAKSFS